MPRNDDDGGAPRQEIATDHAEGRLLAHLVAAITDLHGSEREAFLELAVSKHRAGEIDAVTALLDPRVEWGWTPDGLARQQVVTALLPRLAATVERMTAAIGAVQGPMIQHVLDEAFLSWCEANIGRADEVIAWVGEGRHVPDRFVLCALIAGLRTDPGRYLDISASMAEGGRVGGRHLGARALGVASPTDDVSAAHAVAALGSVIRDHDVDGTVRAGALSAAMDIAARAPSAPSEQFVALLRVAQDESDPAPLDACAHAFGRHAPSLSAPLLDCMPEVLSKLDAGRTGAIDDIDMGLCQLLSQPGGNDRALGILEALLRREDGDAIFERLDSTRHALSSSNGARLDEVVVRWLLSGEVALGNAAAKVVGGVHGQEPLLAVDAVRFPLGDIQASFLARKAIGWLFIKPTAATSLLLSLLPQVTDEGAVTVAELLYDPLLLNYPGSTRRLLENAQPGPQGGNREAADRILARHDAYLQAIEAVGSVPELHQSERNRRIEAQREDDGFKVARKAAEGQSIIRLIARSSLLLHGTRSISYVEDFGGGDARRFDSKLGRISMEIERPMQWTFDPLGLEHTLLAFRLERPPR